MRLFHLVEVIAFPYAEGSRCLYLGKCDAFPEVLE